MAVLKKYNDKELIISCMCGCDEGIHITVEDLDDSFLYCTYTNGRFYGEQSGVLTMLKKKLCKIWAIICNKDYYYSEIVMSKEEFKMYKDWLCQFGGDENK